MSAEAYFVVDFSDGEVFFVGDELMASRLMSQLTRNSYWTLYRVSDERGIEMFGGGNIWGPVDSFSYEML